MVEWKKLGEVANLVRGKVISKDYIRDLGGEYPVYSSQTANDGVLGNINSYMFDGDYLTWTTDGAYAGTIFRRKGKFSITNVCGLIDISCSNIQQDFLYFWLSKTAKNYVLEGMGNPKLMSNVASTIPIPIPSLEEQTRIVGILDTFTSAIDNLKEQIAQRRKQYEYYRDQLLDFEGKPGVEMKTLGVIGKCIAGATPSTKESSYWDNGNIPWMSSGEIHQGIITHTATFITQKGYDNSSTKMLPIGTVVIALAGQGKTRGSAAITAIKLCTNQSLCGIVIDDANILNKFVYFYLKTRYNDLRRISSGEGTRGGLNLKLIGSYPIPLPSLSEQSRIVSILDTFEASIQNLEAQLKEREKQYEYYRNKLLTFE